MKVSNKRKRQVCLKADVPAIVVIDEGSPILGGKPQTIRGALGKYSTSGESDKALSRQED